MVRLFIFLSLAIGGCTAADSIQLDRSPDGGALSIKWPSDNGGDPSIAGGAVDPFTTPSSSAQECDGGLCPTANSCSGSDCPDGSIDGVATDIPCDHNVDCLIPGTLCPGPNSLCIDASQPTSCGTEECGTAQVCRDCPSSPTECADALSCESSDRVCLNLHGAECENSCNCADQLICDVSNQRCVQCLTTEAHCTIVNVSESDQPETCNAAGVCSPIVDLTIPDLDVVRSLMVQEILLQVKDLNGGTARALITFEQTVPFTKDGQTITSISPEIVLTEDRCSVVRDNLDTIASSFTAEEKERTLAVFGCSENGSQTNRFIWEDSLSTPGLGQIGCLMYRPRLPSNDGTCNRWRVWLGPCDAVWTARLDDSICSTGNTEPTSQLDAGVSDATLP